MWTIFVVQLVGLISPGPDFFYVSRQAMSRSRRSAILATIGITFGVGFWALIVLFGLAVLNRLLPNFQQILMLIGGSYLAYSGLKMVQITQNAALAQAEEVKQSRSAWQEILGGLLINLSNPKIVVFFSSVLAGYVSNLDGLSDILWVLLMLTGSALIYFWLVALLFSHRKIRQFYAKYNRYLDNFAGVIFILFGISLVYEGLSVLLG
ncbi:membrane protein [[Actinobacillus] muris]|uniref:Membrane protein n=1 Tax=Muribacter muris TaxID=67855 RepID=A0A0J5P860_9PAST|nr:LysE family transporter [Muribacter muris]KMK52416.1 membrane protein [[Actinobacillus] muris] [Muribacter muris]